MSVPFPSKKDHALTGNWNPERCIHLMPSEAPSLQFLFFGVPITAQRALPISGMG